MVGYKGCVGVIGATSIVGKYLLPLLVEEGWNVAAFSRRTQNVKESAENQRINVAVTCNIETIRRQQDSRIRKTD